MPPVTSTPPGGRGPVRVTTGGSPLLGEPGRNRQGLVVGPTGPRRGRCSKRQREVAPQWSTDFQLWSWLADLDGLLQRLLERVRLDGDGVRVIAGDIRTALCRQVMPRPPAAPGVSGPNSTATLPPATLIETSRSRGITQRISRHTASAMVCFLASSSDGQKLDRHVRGVLAEAAALGVVAVRVRVVGGREVRGLHELAEPGGLEVAVAW